MKLKGFPLEEFPSKNLVEGNFLLIYPPLVKSGLSGPPLGIQHLAWSLRSFGGNGTAVDMNIEFARELISNERIKTLQRQVKRSSLRGVMLDSLATMPENERLKFPRAFDIAYPVGNGVEAGALSDGDQRKFFLESLAFNSFYRRLIHDSPKLVGISILSHSQLLYAIEIAKAVRAHTSAKIVFGGSEISGWPDERIKDFAASHFVDHVVLGDGEHAIRRLWIGDITCTKIVKGEPIPLSQMPAEFSFSIDSNLYLLPKQFNIVESKGCYWNRCTHCDYIALNENLDTSRSIVDLVDSLAAQAEKSGVWNFHLVNETLTPSRAKKLATEIARRQSSIKWNSFVKIDRRFNRDILSLLPGGGCDFLVIGLESLSDRALQVLDKGYTSSEALDWIRTARSCGVNLVLNFIVGIPGTTAEDEDLTLDRLAEFPELAARSKVFSFVLSRMSLMGKSPSNFGLKIIEGESLATDAHRGGSSVRFSKPIDIDERLARFRLGLQKLISRHRLSGPLARIVLAARYGQPVPEAVVIISSSVSATIVDKGYRTSCEVYDYRNGTNLSLPVDLYPILRDLIMQRSVSAAAYFSGKHANQRAELLQYLSEAGFARVESSI